MLVLTIVIYCLPPDIVDLLGGFLDELCEEIAGIPGLEGLKFGIQLPQDLSPYKIGDTIWADAEFRGEGVKSLNRETIDQVQRKLFRKVEELVLDHVNAPERLSVEDNVKCTLILVHVKAFKGGRVTTYE